MISFYLLEHQALYADFFSTFHQSTYILKTVKAISEKSSDHQQECDKIHVGSTSIIKVIVKTLSPLYKVLNTNDTLEHNVIVSKFLRIRSLN